MVTYSFTITKKDVGIKEKAQDAPCNGVSCAFSYGVSSRPFPIEAAWP